jgi:hypothetical protein
MTPCNVEKHWEESHFVSRFCPNGIFILEAAIFPDLTIYISAI